MSERWVFGLVNGETGQGSSVASFGARYQVNRAGFAGGSNS